MSEEKNIETNSEMKKEENQQHFPEDSHSPKPITSNLKTKRKFNRTCDQL